MLSEALDRLDVLNQVIEIVDMFWDENILLSADILHRTPAARRLFWSEANRDAKELVELCGDVANMHATISYAARLISDAIREKFGLPAKKDED